MTSGVSLDKVQKGTMRRLLCVMLLLSSGLSTSLAASQEEVTNGDYT